MLRTHRDTLLSILETLVHDPLVEWVPKNAKSGAEEQENAMARDAMATIEGDLHAVTDLNVVCSVATCCQYLAWEQCAPLHVYWFGLLAGA